MNSKYVLEEKKCQIYGLLAEPLSMEQLFCRMDEAIQGFLVVADSIGKLLYRTEAAEQSQTEAYLASWMTMELFRDTPGLHQLLHRTDTVHHLEWYCIGFGYDNHPVGCIALCCQRELGEDAELLRAMAIVTGVKYRAILSLPPQAAGGGPISHTLFFQDIIQRGQGGHVHVDVDMERTMDALGWQARRNQYVLAIELREMDAPSSTCASIYSRLSAAYPPCYCWCYSDQMMVILLWDGDRDFLLKKSQRRRLAQCVERLNVTAGVSRCFADISVANVALEQAASFRWLPRQERYRKRLIFFDEVLIERMIDLCNQHVVTRDLIHPSLVQLMNYDRKNNTNFCESLFVYLEEMKQVSKAARRLYIHPNTLSYRINRILSIVDLDLNSGYEFCQLLISFYILLQDPYNPLSFRELRLENNLNEEER